MNKTIFTIALFFVCLTLACAAQKNNSLSATAIKDTAGAPAPQPTEITEKPDEALQKQIEQIAVAAKGRVGAKAMLLETGETVAYKSSESFPMQSVYKLPIGMAVLRLVDAGKLTLDQKVRFDKNDFVTPGQRSPIRDANPNGAEMSISELLRYAVSESDGTASDVLLKLAGGSQGAMNYLSEIKVSGIAIANTEKEFGVNRELQYKNYASPDGAIELLRALHEKRDNLSEQSRAQLFGFMIESPTGPNRLRGLLPKNAVVAHKTGSGGLFRGVTTATNDIGIITLPNGRHLAIAVFVSDSQADEKTREAVIAKIAKAVWDKWGN